MNEEGYIVMLKVRAQNTPAELANVLDDERCAQLSPGNVVCRFGIVDHSVEKWMRTRKRRRDEDCSLIQLGNEIVGGRRLS